jgi:hypothetical protein
MQYNLIAIGLFVAGFAILFFVDNFIAKDTDNSLLKTIKDNNLVLGLVCLGAGYYVYSLGEKKAGVTSPVQNVEQMSIESGESDLPTYEEAISTDEALNL